MHFQSCTHNHTQVPNGAAGWYLLGRINRLTGRPARAAEFYSKALTLDPMLWVAFTELCMLGVCCLWGGWVQHEAA